MEVAQKRSDQNPIRASFYSRNGTLDASCNKVSNECVMTRHFPNLHLPFSSPTQLFKLLKKPAATIPHSVSHASLPSFLINTTTQNFSSSPWSSIDLSGKAWSYLLKEHAVTRKLPREFLTRTAGVDWQETWWNWSRWQPPPKMNVVQDAALIILLIERFESSWRGRAVMSNWSKKVN